MKASKAHRILGIDPGTNVMGYAIIEIRNREINLLSMGVLKMSSYDNHYKKLNKIHVRVSELIDQYKPSEFAIEAPFYGKNPQSMLKLGRAQGVAISAGMLCGLNVVEYSPKKIKLSITGNGNASKEQLAHMLPHIVNMQNIESKFLDATDALAAAVCHHFQGGMLSTGSTRYSDWSAFIKDNPQRAR